MSRATVDATMSAILAELETKQAAAFLKNKKYAQLLPTHDETPESSVDVKVSLIRDEDIVPTLPAKLDFAIRVDEIESDKECGWVVRAWVKEDGTVYQKDWGYEFGESESQDWTITDIGPAT